jgi:hypothetical protein
VIIDRLGPPEVVDADDERPEVLECANRPQINQRQGNAHNREQGESDLQVGICDHWITVLFEIEPLRIEKTGIVVHARKS